MTALLCDDVLPTPPASRLTLAPETRPAARRRPERAGGDPLVDGTARLLSIPLRQVYAVLFRMGLIEVAA
jgi:hypothetical protein